jgi:hypothetical protein
MALSREREGSWKWIVLLFVSFVLTALFLNYSLQTECPTLPLPTSSPKSTSLSSSSLLISPNSNTVTSSSISSASPATSSETKAGGGKYFVPYKGPQLSEDQVLPPPPPKRLATEICLRDIVFEKPARRGFIMVSKRHHFVMCVTPKGKGCLLFIVVILLLLFFLLALFLVPPPPSPSPSSRHELPSTSFSSGFSFLD